MMKRKLAVVILVALSAVTVFGGCRAPAGNGRRV